MSTTNEAATLALISNIAEAHGCRLIDVDLVKRIIELEGSEENKLECALALEDAMN